MPFFGVYRIIEAHGKPSLDTIYKPGIAVTHKAAYELGTFLNHVQGVSDLAESLLKRRDLETECKFRPRAILASGANVPAGAGAFWALAWDASILWDSRLLPVGQAFYGYFYPY